MLRHGAPWRCAIRDRLGSGAVEGYLQELRRKNDVDWKKNVEASKNIGRRSGMWKAWNQHIPGLRSCDLDNDTCIITCSGVVDKTFDIATSSTACSDGTEDDADTPMKPQ